MVKKNPTAFVSYSWDSKGHKSWVKDLATRLRSDGIDAKLVQWETVPGDHLTHFMEQGIRDHNFVILICTPKYRQRSDAREGGVGYEGDIMTAEVFSIGDDRKFIPILRAGTWDEAAPSWVKGKRYIDLSGQPYGEAEYTDLIKTLQGERESAPSLGPAKVTDVRLFESEAPRKSRSQNEGKPVPFRDIRIIRLMAEEVTEPRNDGTRGSALYTVPFLLSDSPPLEWARVFLDSWDSPSHFTLRHRPGIARVTGTRILLEGTTVEEVEEIHLNTLKDAVQTANDGYRSILLRREQRSRVKQEERQRHRRRVDETASRITFD